MPQVSRISCVECRRRKIKCNKHQPCDQCLKREMLCDYPRKFRKIEIDKLNPLLIDESGECDSGFSDEYTAPSGSKTSPPSESKGEQDERLILLRKIKDLEKVINNLDHVSHDVNDPSINCYQGKYYGPTSAISMLSDFASTLGPQSFMFDRNPNYRSGRKQEMRNFNHPSSNNISAAVLSKAIPKFHVDPEKNQLIIVGFVQRFFLFDCSVFFNHAHVMSLVSDGPIRKDEDFMTLLMVLLTGISRRKIHDGLAVPTEDEKFREYEKYIPSLISEFNILKRKSTLLLNVIMADLLLFEFYFYTFRTEIAWTNLFGLISSCYSLGLHISTADAPSRLVWWAVNYYESLLCLMLGRPNAISPELLAHHPSYAEVEGRLQWQVEVTMLGKESNALIFHSMQTVDYPRVQALLSRYDDVAARLSAHIASNPHDWLRRTTLILLLTNHAKLHQPFMRTHTASKDRIVPLVSECLEEIKQTLAYTTASHAIRHLRTISPFADCYFFQTLMVLFTYLSYTKTVTPAVLVLQTNLNLVVSELGERWMNKIVYLTLVINESITNNLNDDYFKKANENPSGMDWYTLSYNERFFLQLPETVKFVDEMDGRDEIQHPLKNSGSGIIP